MSSPEVAQALSDIEASVARIRAAVATPAPAGVVTVKVTDVTSSSVTVQWETARTDVASWTVGRDGSDTSGTGPWSTTLAGTERKKPFTSLRPATTYHFTVTPAGGAPVTVAATTAAGTSTGGGGGSPPDSTAAHGPQALAAGWVPLLRASDNFDGTAVGDQWSLYTDPKSQHGNRQPSQFSIVADSTALGGRALHVAATGDGKTGGMAHKVNQKYGRWAGRMRVPSGDPRWHPVLLLWSRAENWPVGGEVDFSEGKCSVNEVEFFLHYGKDNRQTSGSIKVDITQWHWWECEVAPDGVRGWCDGGLFFEDKDPSHIPPGAMHGTIQLDWFPEGTKSTGPGEMLVDAYRVYRHPSTAA